MVDVIAGRQSKWFSVGIVAASVGLSIGTVIGFVCSGLSRSVEIPVYATATHGRDNNIMATGALDDDVEIVVYLDALTADLKAAALNVRKTKFQVYYARNIKNDFKSSGAKNPRYLMTTGRAEFNNLAGRRFARSIVYVTELNTGQCIAYAMQSFPNRNSANQALHGAFIPLDHVEFRQVMIAPGTAVGRTD